VNKRQTILEHIRVAGYNDDFDRAMRLYIENRVISFAFKEAYSKGQKQRKEINDGR